ncbi:MAG: hypothetical protein JXM73_26075 [Anaerolineae bacterium]|nr:hypothetical protein [Anaerolineae bacterium]
MSEYQYYEFQAIDRPLTEEEQRAVARLSSRVEPHPRQAVFVYNWSSFRSDPAKILAQYYDAMLYMANWGSRQLMFRFPKAILDLDGVRAYCQPPIVEDYLSLSTMGEYAILNIEFHEEEGDDWVEGEGWLPAMIGLRDDILRGDYRALYLAWLKTLKVEDLLESVVEPPVPPELARLTPALRRFGKFFKIDSFLIKVAAKASGDRQAAPDGWLGGALARLEDEERDAFLLRLAQGEPHLSAALNRRLREIVPMTEPEVQPRRTVGQLLRQAKEKRKQERRRQAAEAEARRLQELEALAGRQAEAWAEVEALIEERKAKPYEEAVRMLVKLRDLARHQGKEVAFQERVNGIYERYSRRLGLLDRLRDAGLGPL